MLDNRIQISTDKNPKNISIGKYKGKTPLGTRRHRIGE